MQRVTRAVALALALCLMTAASATASASYDAHTVIVQFRPGVSATAQQAALGSATVASTINGLDAKVVRVTGDPATAAAALNRSAVVQYAEVNKILRATATPNDARFGELYGMQKIQAPAGWDAAGLGAFPATGGPKVGIVDTGIRATHEDLSGKVANCARSQGVVPVLGGSIQEGTCADDNGHGSHVAGTIAAKANNTVGVAGVAFNSPLAICKALGGPLGTGATSDVANCITYLKDKGARVISMSLGGGDSTTLHNAVAYAYANGAGALPIAAAGNDGNSTVNYPAGYAEVVSVAATDQNDAKASFSNTNPDVEVAAPGVNVLSSYNSSDSSYTTLSGTSMATPHASGVAAIIAGKNPSFNAASIRSKLDASIDDLGTPGRDPSFGFGRVNLLKAAT
jgi:thermitase